MALEKQIFNEKIEIVGDYKSIGIKVATAIYDDGVEVNKSYHRKVLQPCEKDIEGNWVDTDISAETQDVQDVCNLFWTDALKESYKAYIDSQENLGD